MVDVAPAPLTVDAVLAWAEEQPDRCGLKDGGVRCPRGVGRHRDACDRDRGRFPPSSVSRDHDGKLAGSFMVPSIHRPSIVDAERRILVHHARRGDEVATRILRSGPLRLDPPGPNPAIEDLFGAPSGA